MNTEERQEKLQNLIKYYGLDEAEALKCVNLLDGLDKAKEDMGVDLILEYAKKIRPVMAGTQDESGIRIDDEGLQIFWIESSNISTQSCFYNAKPISKAEGLKEIGRITSYHKYGGAYIFLRPSADEAIFQCPKDILDKVCAFRCVSYSYNINEVYSKILDRHVLTTIYYEGVVPEDIASQPVEW